MKLQKNLFFINNNIIILFWFLFTFIEKSFYISGKVKFRKISELKHEIKDKVFLESVDELKKELGANKGAKFGKFSFKFMSKNNRFGVAEKDIKVFHKL